MPKLDAPLLLAPDFKEKIWGRENLEPLYTPCDLGRGSMGSSRSGQGPLGPNEKPRRIGEAWLTGDSATFLTGPVAGLTLGEVYRRWPEQFGATGLSDGRFPFLAKFLFTRDWLSMQVHPDDDYAARHEKSAGKAEMWYFVDCDEGAEIALALRPSTDLDTFRAACLAGTSLDLAQRFFPEHAEAAFVPPGTVHAIGPGLTLFEVSENSDVTYRLDDYGRVDDRGNPRELHLERGFEVIRAAMPAHFRLPRLAFEEPFGSRRYVTACRYFAVEDLVLRERSMFAASPGRVEGLVVIDGEGRVENDAGWLAYRPGHVWLVPPQAGRYRLVPEEPTRMLRFYVPDLDADFRQPLGRLGVSETSIREVLFD
jgi:mannose-6-phosphate isomerase